MMILGDITDPSAVNSQLSNYASLWETTGAAFGPFVGSEMRIPTKPELWLLRDLAALKQTQTRFARNYPVEFERHWEGVYKARGNVFGDNYDIRRSKNLPTDLVRELEREWLALDPHVARYNIAQTRPGISPEAVLAGASLYDACQAIVASAKGVDTLPVRAVGHVEMGLNDTEWPFRTDGDYVALPFGLQIFKVKKSLYIRPSYRDWFRGIDTEFLRIHHEDASVMLLKDALVAFVRELLKASATIGFTLNHEVDSLDLDSRPVIGVIQNGYKSLPGKAALACVKDGKLGVCHAVVPSVSKAMWKYDDAVCDLSDLIIEQWHQRTHLARGDWERLAFIDLSAHARLVQPLVDSTPWFSGDAGEVLAYAKSASDTVRDHVTEKEGRYVVTRHGLTSKLPILTTDDVTLAIRLALAHHTDHKWSLGLVAS